MQYKAAVIFHSICGNTYLLAKCFEKALNEQGVEVLLYRTVDTNHKKIAEIFKPATEYLEEIHNLPIIENPEILKDCDMIFMGSPTYFGNVSGPIKLFMDSFIDLWENSPLNKAYFGAFATYSTPHGGSAMCLRALNLFAEHLGMPTFPIKSNLGPIIQPPYGIVHHSGENVLSRPNADTQKTVSNYIADCIDLLNR